MSYPLVKFRSCSRPSVTFWLDGESPGELAPTNSYQFLIQGSVYKLRNFNDTVTTNPLVFLPNQVNCGEGWEGPPELERPCETTFSEVIDSEECWTCELIVIAISIGPGQEYPVAPWIADPGLGWVQGIEILEIHNSCENCLSGSSSSGNETCEGTPTTTTSGCGNSDCGCDDGVTACITAPPDCGDDCDDCSCEEVMPSQCVVYNGPRVECLGISPGMSMNQVIALIGSNLCNTPITADCSDIECANNPESGCKSPLEFVFGPLFDFLSDNSITTSDDVESSIRFYLDSFWRDGVIQSNDCDDPICCQECCNDAFYFLGAAQLGFALFELTQYPACCINSRYSTEIAINGVTTIQNEGLSANIDDLLESATGRQKVGEIEGAFSVVTVTGQDNSQLIFGNTKQCCTDGKFDDCLSEIYDQTNNDPTIVDVGLIESQYANNTILCDLLEYLNKSWIVTLPNGFQSQFYLTTDNKIQILEYFLYSGFVVSCCNGQVFVGGSEVFMELITAGTLSACIQPKVVPTFDFGPFCLDAVVPLPAAVSLEGITGSWVETSVDTSTEGNNEGPLTFIPDPGQNAYSVEVFYEVVEVVPNDLNLIACEDTAGSGIATIDLTLEEPNIYAGAGNTYEWFADPTLVTPVTDPTAAIVSMIGGLQSLYCRVTDENGCQGVATVTYTPGSPVFDFTPVQGAGFCTFVFEVNNQGDPVPALPNPTNGVVTGSWSPAVIDVSVAGFTQYTFTPTSGCDPRVITIQVLNPGDPSPC